MRRRHNLNVTANNHKVNLHLIDDIYRVMSGCYGPYGYPTIISGGSETETFATRDGVTILNSMADYDRVALHLIPTIQKIAVRNDMKGGDGTTSTTLFLYNLYKYCAESDIIPDVNVVKELEGYIKEHAYVPNEYETLLHVARVALNNSDEHLKPLRSLFEEMEEKGIDWRTTKIIPRMTRDILIEKVTTSATRSVKSLGMYSFTRELSGAYLVYIKQPLHNVSDFISVLPFIQALINVFREGGINKPIIVASSSISNTVYEYAAEFVNKAASIGSIVDFVEFANEACATSEGSEELAIALEAPIVNVHAMVMEGSDGNMHTVKPDDEASLKEYIKAVIVNTLPTVNMFAVEDGMSFTKTSEPSILADKRRSTIEKIKLLKKNANTMESINEYNARLEILEGVTVVLDISAATEERRKMIYDMYRDACGNMIQAKEGIIAGCNIGLLIAARKLKPSPTKDCIVKALGAMIEIMLNHRQRKIGLAVDPTYNAIMEVIVSGMENNDIITGYDIIKNTPSKLIINSYKNELNVIKSGLEMVELWMSSTQITWPLSEKRAQDMYNGYITAMESDEDNGI